MLWYALIAIAVVLVGVVGYASTISDEFTVTRDASINADAAKVFAQFDDFHRWGAWSPWEKMDPNLARTFSGAEHGVGAKYAWVGNKKVGTGSMQITESVAPSRLALDLHFMAPFEARNRTEFTFADRQGATHVSWTMKGKRPFFMKVMGIFMNFDNMIGRDFEAGLANVKALVEQ